MGPFNTQESCENLGGKWLELSESATPRPADGDTQERSEPTRQRGEEARDGGSKAEPANTADSLRMDRWYVLHGGISANALEIVPRGLFPRISFRIRFKSENAYDSQVKMDTVEASGALSKEGVWIDQIVGGEWSRKDARTIRCEWTKIQSTGIRFIDETFNDEPDFLTVGDGGLSLTSTVTNGTYEIDGE